MKKQKTKVFLFSVLLLLCSCKTKENKEETIIPSTSMMEESTVSISETVEVTEKPEEDGEEIQKKMNSLELVRAMGNGINLGNTLEAYNHKQYLKGGNPDGFERVWGQPYTTKRMIEGMKASGFDTLRIPVAWTNGMRFEDGDYTIDERLLKRVETVVNYALEADMYVIINDHWDGGWWGMFGSDDPKVCDNAMNMYLSMWTQIGNYFQDYSYKLIFESANEELGDRLNDKDITGTPGILTKDECYQKTNEINQAFVDCIRSLSGKNKERFLLIAGYNTDIANTCDMRFKMPKDTVDGKLLISVHYYTPWDYCGMENTNDWGFKANYKQQNDLFKMISKFSDEGYGIVIGEYAVMTKNHTLKPGTELFYKNLLDNCDLYDCCPVLWDCSDLYDRKTASIWNEELATLFQSRRYEVEKDKSILDVKKEAQNRIEENYRRAKVDKNTYGNIGKDVL